MPEWIQAAKYSPIAYWSFRRFIAQMLTIFGGIQLFGELYELFIAKLPEPVKKYWWLFLLSAVFVAFWRSIPEISRKCRIGGTDVFIEMRVVDVLSLSDALIVASNRTFDTSLEEGIISAESLQGRVTKLYFPSVPSLDLQIEVSLANEQFTECDRMTKSRGKLKLYGLGSVASVVSANRRFYFLALATLNAHGNAQVSVDDLLDSFPRLWEYIRTRGEFTPLVVPILGSGRSRVKATRDQIIQEIIRSFIAATREGSKFCERLTIAIAPADLKSGTVDLRGAFRFLEHECQSAQRLAPEGLTRPAGQDAALDH